MQWNVTSCLVIPHHIMLCALLWKILIISFNAMRWNVMLWDATWGHVIACDVMICNMMPCDCMWCQMITYYVMLCKCMSVDVHCYNMAYHLMQWDGIRCHVMPCDAMWCHVMPCDAMWCDMTSPYDMWRLATVWCNVKFVRQTEWDSDRHTKTDKQSYWDLQMSKQMDSHILNR